MRIDQRNAGGSITPTDGSYNLDRWTTWLSQTSKITLQQNQGSVTPPTGFTNYLGITSSSAYTVGVGEVFAVRQHIEGYNIADLAWGTANAKTITLSFWVRSSLTGTFGGALANSDFSKTYPFSYTISSANTWEQKTVTVAGPTDGTWNTTNSQGITVVFSLGSGANVSGTAGTWSGNYYVSSTGATSVVGTNGATFYVTGVQLEVGSTATPFERRQFGNELSLCQRYFEKSYDYGTAIGANVVTDSQSVYVSASISQSKAWGTNLTFQVAKRSIPSVTIWNRAGTSGQWYWGALGVNEATGTTIIAGVSQYQLQVLYSSTYGAGANAGYGLFAADAEL
jgi:hypothetical protein